MAIIDINARFGSYPSRYKTTSADDLAIEAQAHKVDLTCAISTTGSFFSDFEGNAETLDACSRHDGNLIPIATLNPKTTLLPKESVDEIKRSGFKAVRFFPHEQGWPIEYAPLAELLGFLAIAKLPAIVTCAKPGDVTLLTKLVKAHLIDSGVPVILESITVDTFAESLSAMRECENLVVETHSLRFPDGLVLLRDVVGAERILFGSGASAQSIGGRSRSARRCSTSLHPSFRRAKKSLS
jgi:predicted TIM-barrel fold metal-dependent hydrolase